MMILRLLASTPRT